MLPLQELPLLPIIIFTLSFCSVWTVDAFVDSDDAEAALCANRTAFVQRDVKTLIPSHIWKQIAHPGDITQNVGFQKLFLILNTNPAADGLRQLVVDYFNDSPPLRAHLSESRFILWIMRRIVQAILVLQNSPALLHPPSLVAAYQKKGI